MTATAAECGQVERTQQLVVRAYSCQLALLVTWSVSSEALSAGLVVGHALSQLVGPDQRSFLAVSVGRSILVTYVYKN